QHEGGHALILVLLPRPASADAHDAAVDAARLQGGHHLFRLEERPQRPLESLPAKEGLAIERWPRQPWGRRAALARDLELRQLLELLLREAREERLVRALQLAGVGDEQHHARELALDLLEVLLRLPLRLQRPRPPRPLAAGSPRLRVGDGRRVGLRVHAVVT